MRSFNILSASVFALVLCITSLSQAAFYSFVVKLDGPSESPANSSLGKGTGTVTFDTTTHLMGLNVSFSGLTGNVSASHIHAATAVALTGTAGVATTTPTFAGFPSGVTAGTYSNTLDMTLASSYNPAFVTANGSIAGAETALLNAMISGKAYWNIHTSAFPGGEIRGFTVPEPTSIGMAIVGGITLLARRAKRKLAV